MQEEPSKRLRLFLACVFLYTIAIIQALLVAALDVHTAVCRA